MNSTPDDPLKSPWIHPVHAKGVQSRRYDAATEGLLTNAAILRYALAGRYGEVVQRNAQALLDARRAKRDAAKIHAKKVASILAELDDL